MWQYLRYCLTQSSPVCHQDLPQECHETADTSPVYPLQNSTAGEDTVAFRFDSGAYTTQTSAGAGYRGDAAAAKFFKEIAREFYGDTVEQVYGYIYGGSGGSLQTVGAIENTIGVWDRGLALIQAIPISNPDNFCIRALAGLVLGEKADQVIDGVQPGGSGNAFAGHEEAERLVLLEATALGMPWLAGKISRARQTYLEAFRPGRS
ncbi:predicted protein [Aspergillus nidulans FGSC A4]|uniref:Carboxylic ester hydrolase n=1 Tax=Emericella nidulans (strain FGSC A4 / ATCC 38163 / CBS 112.46 / NRRL 194 / M139) TaxID=227321 RepID=Q5BG52_EMENI|nr:hypothetical protein [Aspergillus nidulans FGSC A4]EAA66577.1 predicted protein [Aspergillus nidulans FGSC A4]CBF89408.1 TPA: conserved hypothetical protein [Aspergillus nidulans FGSC A4]|eukprot:XP_658082.1 predicted protein [Aspergillus nidulans FGSC A4]